METLNGLHLQVIRLYLEIVHFGKILHENIQVINIAAENWVQIIALRIYTLWYITNSFSYKSTCIILTVMQKKPLNLLIFRSNLFLIRTTCHVIHICRSNNLRKSNFFFLLYFLIKSKVGKDLLGHEVQLLNK